MFPDVPFNAITVDLANTRSVSQTVDNILSGTAPFQRQSPQQLTTHESHSSTDDLNSDDKPDDLQGSPSNEGDITDLPDTTNIVRRRFTSKNAPNGNTECNAFISETPKNVFSFDERKRLLLEKARE